MRFVSLEVTWFQGIKSAHVDFEPGLNVLYGPNDLGKSTLVTALRAALLLPVTATEAEKYHPWHADENASVTLVFCDGTGKYWRVEKTFGGHAGAKLLFSKDGLSWVSEAKGRDVEGKLRTLLPWGVALPGGAGAGKGLPKTFLTNALLGPQDEVASILEGGLGKDGADSG